MYVIMRCACRTDGICSRKIICLTYALVGSYYVFMIFFFSGGTINLRGIRYLINCFKEVKTGFRWWGQNAPQKTFKFMYIYFVGISADSLLPVTHVCTD